MCSRFCCQGTDLLQKTATEWVPRTVPLPLAIISPPRRLALSPHLPIPTLPRSSHLRGHQGSHLSDAGAPQGMDRHLSVSDPGTGAQRKARRSSNPCFPQTGTTHVKWKHGGHRADEVQIHLNNLWNSQQPFGQHLCLY